MTPGCTESEFADVVALIDAAWPNNRTWTHPEDTWPLFRHIPAVHVDAAARDWIGRPKPPNPSQLVASAQERARAATPNGPCTHPYREIVDIEGGYRQGRCIRCDDVRIGTPEQLPTVGEREERRRTRPTTTVEPEFDVDDEDESW